MASDAGTVDFVLDQLRAGGAEVSAKKMFGEYGLYLGGKMVAMICDDQLFMKSVPGTTAMLADAEQKPPYPGAKPHAIVDAGRWDDVDWMADLFRVTAAELPAPKPKKAKKQPV